jgi:hypothetical protein
LGSTLSVAVGVAWGFLVVCGRDVVNELWCLLYMRAVDLVSSMMRVITRYRSR